MYAKSQLSGLALLLRQTHFIMQVQKVCFRCLCNYYNVK